MNVVAVQYSPSVLKIQTVSSLEDAKLTPSGDSVLWLDVSDYNELYELLPLEKNFNVHTFALEDCFHVRQRPKIEEYKNYLFLICRTVLEENGKYREGHQLGIFFAKNIIITIHKEKMQKLSNVLGDVKERKPQLVQSPASFLLYSLLDEVVNDLEEAVKKVEETESLVGDEVLGETKSKNLLELIYSDRSSLLLVRRLLRQQNRLASNWTIDRVFARFLVFNFAKTGKGCFGD